MAAAALADWLFWDRRIGLSLAIFCVGLALSSCATHPRPSRRRAAPILLVLVVGLAPAVEDVTPLSFAFALLATSAAAGLTLPASPPMSRAATAAALRCISGPRRIRRDLSRRAAWLRSRAKGVRRPLHHLAWLLPLAAGSVFLALFADANPVIADLLATLYRPTASLPAFAARGAFWLAVAVAVWPVIRPRRTVARVGHAPIAAAPRPRGLGAIPPILRDALFGDAAVTRALLLCNGLFALELGLDAAYLWAGATLPHGMSYAEYAHRGAYPLMLTALVAGGFVLLVRREGIASSHPRTTSILLTLFIGQNILLLASAAERLGLYVGAYGLTVWRVAAFCWMGLVASGLVLVALQGLGGRSNGWLASRTALVAAAVLYGWSLADVSGLVARYDVAHCREVAGSGPALDLATLVELGPSALPAVDAARDLGLGLDHRRYLDEVRDEWARQIRSDAADWRAWSLQAWRLDRWLDKVDAARPAPGRDERQGP